MNQSAGDRKPIFRAYRFFWIIRTASHYRPARMRGIVFAALLMHTVAWGQDTRFKDDALPGEEVFSVAGESIEGGESTSAWRAYAASGSPAARTRVLLFDFRVNSFRAVLHKEGIEPQAFSLPTPPADSGEMYRVSDQDLRERWGNSAPDTFYVEPKNFRRFGMDVAPDFVKVGAVKRFRGLVITTPDPKATPAPGATPNQAAAKYDGGLMVYFIVKLPRNAKDASSRIDASFNYRLSFVPEKPDSVIKLERAMPSSARTSFYESRGENLIPDGKDHFYSESSPLFQPVTAFIFRFVLKGRGKGGLSIWNIQAGYHSYSSAVVAQKDIPDGDEVQPPFNAAFESELLAMVNAARSMEGLPSLIETTDLTRAARYHAGSMVKDGYFSHDSFRKKDGALVETADACSRISRFFAMADAENIAKNFDLPKVVFDAWMHEPSSRKNILSPTAVTSGVGFQAGYWVQDFGGRAASLNAAR